jgi:hypothetical protein
VLIDKTGVTVPLKDIKFCHKEHTLFILGHTILYHDRYIHSTTEEDFPYAIFCYLNFVENILDRLFCHHLKDIKMLKARLKEWYNS